MGRIPLSAVLSLPIHPCGSVPLFQTCMPLQTFSLVKSCVSSFSVDSGSRTALPAAARLWWSCPQPVRGASVPDTMPGLSPGQWLLLPLWDEKPAIPQAACLPLCLSLGGSPRGPAWPPWRVQVGLTSLESEAHVLHRFWKAPVHRGPGHDLLPCPAPPLLSLVPLELLRAGEALGRGASATTALFWCGSSCGRRADPGCGRVPEHRPRQGRVAHA